MLRRRAPGYGLLIAAAVAAALLGAGAAVAEGFSSGKADAIDGSHLAIGGQRFKLYGIDAPDADQTCEDGHGKDYPCGLEARQALAALLKDADVRCAPRGPNQLDELMAVCTVGQTDLAKALVEAGWAIADRARTLYYEEPELAARTAKKGLWQGRFVLPEAWRNGERVPTQTRRGGPGTLPGGIF